MTQPEYEKLMGFRKETLALTLAALLSELPADELELVELRVERQENHREITELAKEFESLQKQRRNRYWTRKSTKIRSRAMVLEKNIERLDQLIAVAETKQAERIEAANNQTGDDDGERLGAEVAADSEGDHSNHSS